MRIENSAEFAKSLNKLSEMDSANQKLETAPNMDLMDYYWFLVSIRGSIEEASKVEVLEDATGVYKYYKILEGNIDDNIPNVITFKVAEDNDMQQKEEIIFDIKEVQDARIVKGYKYYVTTSRGMYRFLGYTS